MLFLFLFLVIPFHSLAKYLYTNFYEHYLTTHNFYFTSDYLTTDNKTYVLNNWGGTEDFIFTFHLLNYLNLDEYTKEDITYRLSFSCSDNVTCEENKINDHLLEGNTVTKDEISINIHPNSIKENDVVTLNITAESASLYPKELKATVILNVNNLGISYNISDSEKALFLALNISNDNENDKKVKLSFDPTSVSIDTTNELVYEGLSTLDTDFIKESVITLKAGSDNTIYFYKKDINKNYSLISDVLNVTVLE